MREISLPDSARCIKLSHGFDDDFDHLVTADRWTTIVSDSGSVSVGDSVGGIAVIDPSDGTVGDNDESYLHLTNELFKFADGKPLDFAARVQFSEANTDDANILVGLISGAAANSLQDNGAGPPASYSGAVFFKADGSTKWSFETSLDGTQTTTETSKTAGGAGYVTLGIRVLCPRANELTIIPLIDTTGGNDLKQCQDANGNLINHTITLGSPTEMALIFGVKNGSASNQETLNVDYVSCWQLR